MSLWWLQPGWTETRCACCGAKVWPDSDPDTGLCLSCFTARENEAEHWRREEQRHAEEMEAEYWRAMETAAPV